MVMLIVAQCGRNLLILLCNKNQCNYDRLNVTLTQNDVGESLYNPTLPKEVADLKAQGLAVEDEGTSWLPRKNLKIKMVIRWGLSQKKDGEVSSTQQQILRD